MSRDESRGEGGGALTKNNFTHGRPVFENCDGGTESRSRRDCDGRTQHPCRAQPRRAGRGLHPVG